MREIVVFQDLSHLCKMVPQGAMTAEEGKEEKDVGERKVDMAGYHYAEFSYIFKLINLISISCCSLYSKALDSIYISLSIPRSLYLVLCEAGVVNYRKQIPT